MLKLQGQYIIKFILCIIMVLLAFSHVGIAQNNEHANKKILKYGSQYQGFRTDTAMANWRSNRFGQFIHWGLYAIPGGVWQGKSYNYAAEFLKSSAKLSSNTWDSLMYQWNPTQFNPKTWAKMAKAMGAKYMTVTTKHHEGFCLWPSQYTNFTVANTPYKKDIIGQLVKAYNDEGLDVHLYYSVLDWHHPDWRYDIKSTEDSLAMRRYLQFAYNQLDELATNYPTVKCFWFDGTWDNSVKKNGWWTLEVEQMLKRKIPGCIVNSRLRADEYGARHFDTNKELMGDYESGYERRLPNPYSDFQVTTRDWEACMTIPENQWGFHKDWTLSYVKTPLELIEMLVKTTSLGGNFLLNFGPNGAGAIRLEEVQIAHTISQWMAKNATAIHGSTYAAGWPKQDWGYYTQKTGTNRIHMVVFNQPINGILPMQLPKNTLIKKAYFLSNPNTALTIKETQKQQYNLFLPKPLQLANTPQVIVLEITTGTDNNNYKDPLF